jgi:hypothetical protein
MRHLPAVTERRVLGAIAVACYSAIAGCLAVLAYSVPWIASGPARSQLRLVYSQLGL